MGGGYDSNVADGLYRMWESRFSSIDQHARVGVLGSRAHEVQQEFNRLLSSLANGSVTIPLPGTNGQCRAI